MKSRRLAALCATTIGLGLAAPAVGGTVTFSPAEGNNVQISGLGGFAVNGADMDGMLVTACFGSAANATADCQTVSWTDSGATSGGVSGKTAQSNSWAVSVGGDTSAPDAWSVVFQGNNAFSLTSLRFDAGDSLVLFDRASPVPGTPGSDSGLDFGIGSAFDVTALVTYINPVMLDGAATAMLDLYQGIKIAFTPFARTGFNFSQDTDNRVPEPGTLLLLGLGALALRAARRRR
jgi:hypothetical protein